MPATDEGTGAATSRNVKPLHGDGFQVEDPADHWVIFTLDELRSHSWTLKAGMVEGSPEVTEDEANLFVRAAFAAARGPAIAHGLIPDDRPPSRS